MNKKYIIASCVSALILVLALLSFFIILKGGKKDDKPSNNNNNETTETITISFDADGGEAVKDIKIKKGETVNLPVTTKKDYLFNGWYYKDSKVSNDTKFVSDTKLVAKWKKVEEGVKTFTITFDSKGGSSVGKMTVECDKELELPNPPTKKDYNFISWVDKNDTPILDGALLTCNDITLYANWEKIKKFKVYFYSEEKMFALQEVECGSELKILETPTKDGYNFVRWEDKNGTPILDGALLTCDDIKLDAVFEKIEKTPKCPDGYELKDGNKCVSMKSPEYYCPDGYTNSSKDNTVCYKYVKEPDKITCKNNGYYYTDNGGKFCGYDELPSYTGNRTGCQGAGGTFVQSNSHCFKRIEQGTAGNLQYDCYNTTYYRTSDDFGDNVTAGCYSLTQREYGCKNVGEGYSINHTYGKCVKTINAQ